MTAKEFYLDTPLYSKMHFAKLEDFYLLMVAEEWDVIEGYNPILKYDTTYRVDLQDFDKEFKKYYSHVLNEGEDLFFTITIVCKRSQLNFPFSYHWSGKGNYVQKVGQWPSLAEFHISQVKQYDKLINKGELKEFTRAIGLAANGVGIGSFVYLRRIFEHLIYESVELKKQEGDFDEEVFQQMRMAERIEYLKNHLPEFLVQHKELYSILSLGIHELTEEDCLVHFEVVKSGIEFILDEKLEKYNRVKKMEAASAKIKTTASNIKK